MPSLICYAGVIDVSDFTIKSLALPGPVIQDCGLSFFLYCQWLKTFPLLWGAKKVAKEQFEGIVEHMSKEKQVVWFGSDVDKRPYLTLVGLRQPGYGTAGRPLAIVTSSFVTTIPDTIIRHYDDFSSDLHPRIRRLLLKKLEAGVVPNIFSIKTVFDGCKNLFASYELELGALNSRQFDAILVPRTAESDRPPKFYKVKIMKVNQINPEVLQAYTNGQYSIDEEILTAIMVLNVVVRMDPSAKHSLIRRTSGLTSSSVEGSFSLFVQALAECSSTSTYQD
ncbi:hypothetical protein C0995_003090 [Termitomyces sp. Mi166|nr:hypothetical protein C0995_003090 [Termitomyces sp. Mi166\